MKNASRTKIGPKLLAALLATAALGVAGSASAVGLGKVVAKSHIGAPFQAEVELVVSDAREADTILVKSAKSEVYERQGVRFTPLLSSLTVRLEERGGRYFAELSSPQTIAEPVVTVILESSTYSGTVRRTYDIPLAVQLEDGPKPPGAAEQAAIDAEKQAKAQAQARAAVKPVKKARARQFVFEKGERPVDIGRITAGGENESLAQALSKIVPTGWRGFAADPTVKAAPSVTWSVKDKPWTEALKEVVSSRGIRAHIDWSKKEVEFSASPKVTLALADDEEDATLTQDTSKLAAVSDDETLRAAPAAAVAHVSPETLAGLKAIRVKGGASVADRAVTSFGVNVGLLSAIAQVVPDGWSVVSREAGVTNDRLVEWNGHDRPWLLVFDEILSKNSYAAKLDTERHEIEIFRA